MDKKLKTRASHREWLKREIVKFKDILQSDISDIEIKTRLERIEKRKETLDSLQLDIESILSDEDLDRHFEEAEVYDELFIEITVLAKQKLVTSVAQNSYREEVTVSSEGVNLPKLNLPKFNGNPMEYFAFWERYDVAVHSVNVPDISKFIYLKSSLEGDALSAIKGLAITPENYRTACDILRDRFGRKEKIIFHHVEALLNFRSLPFSKEINDLWTFRDEINVHIRSLENLGITCEQYGIFLTPIILNKLPVEIRLEWARTEGKESDILYLMDFLYEEIKRKERSAMFESSEKGVFNNRMRKEERGSHRPKTVSTLLSNKMKCLICDKFHKGKTEECFSYVRAAKAQKITLIKQKNLCFSCLAPNHQSKSCTKTCRVCSGTHHESICNAGDLTCERQSTDNNKVVTSGVNHTLLSNKNYQTILQMAKVNISCGGSTKPVNVLLDGGSDHTYVASDIVKRYNLKKVGQMAMSVVSFGCGKPSENKIRSIYSVDLMCKNGYMFNVDATEIPTICAPIYKPKLPLETLSFLQGFDLNLSQEFESNDHVNIDILIGMDYMWHVLSGNVVQIPKTGLVLQNSIFGWVVSGSFKNKGASASSTSTQLHCCVYTENMPHGFQNMWELDSIGITLDEKGTTEDERVHTEFKETVTVEEGGYKVCLPWKTGDVKKKLMNNEGVAKKRLDNLVKRLSKNPQLLTGYLKVFDDLESEGIIVEVPSEMIHNGDPIYYMPHHPVVKESALSTKIRPVFDASCVGENGISLNDCLEAGPCLLPDLISVILRFRRWPIALTADIRQAFLNIRVQEFDTDVHRFLLPLETGNGFKVMKFVRVPFGNKSSPFLLNATVKHHLSNYPPTNTVEELSDNLYVDDLLSGTNNVEDCLNLIQEACEIMSAASLPLTKWASNNVQVNQQLQNISESENCLIVKDSSHKVLGVQWNKQCDCLVFDGLLLNAECSPTKRGVLSVIARMFDPLGLLSPFIMGIKVLFQDIWRAGYRWDETLPSSFRERLDKWVLGLSFIQQIHIDRQYFNGEWDVCKIKCLYAFSDASEKAYGACTYITVERSDGSCSSSLVYSKAKVAPIKTVSLPRLELLGTLLAARLVKFVKASLYIGDEVPVVCFTDSMVALSWIKGNPVRWKTFVRNRVEEIQSLVPVECWYHVHGRDNPADLVSRGVTGQTLKDSNLWFKGPSWLGECENIEAGCEAVTKCDSNYEFEDVRVINESIVTKQLVATSNNVRVFDVSRWGNYLKAIRVVSWVHRFIRNSRVRRYPHVLIKGDLELSELKFGEFSLLKHEQNLQYCEEINHVKNKGFVSGASSISGLNPFVGMDGLLRTRRRLEFSDLDYDEKYPILLPKCDLSILLLRRCHIDMTHAGVETILTTIRRNYWIVGARRLAKNVKSQCIPCKIQDETACRQLTAPLPPERVKQSNPFAVCGVDYAGPLLCNDSPGKKYVLLFVCAVVRCVHVELVDSLSVNDFFMGFTRFVCRRSLPSRIISDNAKTFKTAKEKLLAHYGPNCPQWVFNAPLSPWWGAFWERMVRSIKANLRKSIRNRSLTKCELETTLLEVESCVNSRPLTFVGDNVDAVSPLTPSHFLTPSGSSGVRNPNSNQELISNKWSLAEQYSNRCELIEGFWTRWSDEYLRNLPTMKASLPQGAPNVGSLVLIRDNEYLRRLQWPLGVITKVFPGRDGLVRAVELRTSKGVVVRPIQRIHVLEAVAETENNVVNITENGDKNECEIREATGKIDKGDNNDGIQTLTPRADASSTNNPGYVSRAGRVSKPRNMLDL